MTVLGFSSSPIEVSNVDRMVRFIIENTGKDAEFIKLSELSYGPCRACAHLCAGDNLCKIDDDLKAYFPKIISAEGIVLGTPSYFDNMNGFMTIFLERLWAVRHQRFPLEGKPYVVVSCGIDYPRNAIEGVKRRMTAYRAEFLGSVGFSSQNHPCLRCGYAYKCEVGDFYRRYGEERQKKLKIRSELFRHWEDCAETRKEIERLNKKLVKALD